MQETAKLLSYNRCWEANHAIPGLACLVLSVLLILVVLLRSLRRIHPEVGCLLGLVGLVAVSIGISEGSIPRLVVCLELLHNELLLPVTPSILVSPSASSVCPSPLLLTNAKAAACYVHRMVAYFAR